MKQPSSLKTLVLVFLLFFSLAFQCRSGGDGGSRTGRLTEDIVRQQITEREKASAAVTRGLVSVSVNFESIQIGTPATSSDQERIDGITSDTYYPVRVRLSVTRTYKPSGDETRTFDRKYKFYTDSTGGWNSAYHQVGY